MATKFGYDCHGFKDYLGNVGLRLAMKNYTAQRRLWLPSMLRPKLGARRFALLSLFIVFILSGPFLAQAQQAEPAPAVTVQELEDLAAVMEDKAAREQLLSRIRALIATRKNTQVEPPVASAGARMIAALSENVRETSRQLVAACESAGCYGGAVLVLKLGLHEQILRQTNCIVPIHPTRSSPRFHSLEQ